MTIAACSAPTPDPEAEAEAFARSLRAPVNCPEEHVDVSYPETRREPIVDTIHGREVADPYRWLEDAGDPEVQAWMAAQDEYARARLERLPERDSLRARLEQLSYVDSVSPPARRGPYYFYWRQHKDREKAVYYVRRGERGPERALLDPNAMSADGSVSIHGVFPSHDGARVAYKLSRNNADAATLHVLDTESGRDLPEERLAGARYALPQWTPEGDGFYYTALPDDPSIPPSELPGRASIRFHALGRPHAEDREVWPASGDATAFLAVELSRDGRYLLVYRQRGWLATDVFFATLTSKTRASETPRFRALIEGVDALYDVTPHEGRFFIVTNEGAPRFRVLEADPEAPARADWVERVPQRADVLQGARVVGGRLLLHYLHRARSLLELRSLEGALERELPTDGTVDAVVGRPDEDVAYLRYSSFTETSRIFKLELARGELELWDEVTLPIDLSEVEVEQVSYPSRDG
ncbi:MAG: S9 family peptidase, partial [Myxococcales bacterium]|nr:S9 family peptidase [Myxococcales bacterium]